MNQEPTYAELKEEIKRLKAKLLQKEMLSPDLDVDDFQHLQFLNLIPDLVVVASVEGYFLQLNSFWEDVLGFTLDELKARPFAEFIHPDDVEGTLSEVEKQINKQSTINFVNRYLCKDGSYKWLEWVAIPSPDGSRLYASARDITEKKKIEDELIRHKERFNQVAKCSGIWLWEVDANGLYTYCGESDQTILGYRPDELVGKRYYYDSYPDEFKEATMADTLDAFANKLSFNDFFNPNFHKDGHLIFLETSAIPLLGPNGELIGYRGADKDVTDRKQKEWQLNIEKEKYRSIFENIQDVYYEASMDGVILEISPSVEVFSRGLYRRTELIGSSIIAFYDNLEDRNTFFSMLNATGSVKEFELNVMAKDNTRIPCTVNATILKDDAGRPLKIIGNLHDITARKKVERELMTAKLHAEESNRLKSALLNNMSHEIRTPMNAIMGFSDIMADASHEEKESYAEIIKSSANQLLTLIDDIILLSRLQSESAPLEISRFSPAKLISDIHQMFDLPDMNKGIEIRQAIPEASNDLVIKADDKKIRQVITNLLSNALKYTFEGNVTIGFDLSDTGITFHVTDTGIGIPEKERTKIFDTFYRGEKVLQMAIRGTGLGLNIAAELVRTMGGIIHVDSTEQVGSCFHFTLPLEIAEPGVTPQTPNHQHLQKTYASQSILIVDDEPMNLIYLKHLLNRFTKNLETAANGKEAIDMSDTNRYDLVLMDLKMPAMDGFEATRLLKSRYPNMVIIAQSAYSTPEEEALAMAAGCDYFVSKPVSKDRLFEVLAKCGMAHEDPL